MTNDSKADVEDLAAWLTQIWDEDERLATYALGRPWLKTKLYPDEPWHFLPLYQPELALARTAADRKILARCMRIWSEHEEGGPLNGLVRAVDAGLIVHDLAEPYRDRPGFPESAVERQGVEG